MYSERKIQSARANGAKSRGPKTAAGKARSARNAVTHGLNSQVAVLETESAERFQQLRDSYIAELAPRNQVEADLVDQIVVARWRLERTWTLETALFDYEISRQRPEIEKQFEEIDDPSRIALAFKSLADNSRALALLNRYEIRFTRTIHRALELLRQLRQTPDPPPAESATGLPAESGTGLPARGKTSPVVEFPQKLPNEPNHPANTDSRPHNYPTPHDPKTELI